MSNVLITGANRGIGYALSARFAARGDTVTATTRGALPRADVPGISWHHLDVTAPGDHAALARAMAPGALDLLVCNAGVYLDKAAQIGAGYGAQDWADTFAANVTGVFLTMEAMLPVLRRANNARIAIIGSAMGSDARAPGGSYIYRASKAAALNLGRNLATDFKPDGIAVGVYHPGWVQTDMGGEAAQITVEQSVDGLMAEFDALNMEHSGCFRTFDGQDHAF